MAAYISFQPKDHFNTVTYTGNGSTQSITGVGFRPDWLWIKPRSSANRHTFFDVLRGTNSISSDASGAQVDRSGDGFTSIDSDGFTLNNGGAGGDVNYNSRTHVAWNWKAGYTGSSNSDGTVTSGATVSANTTAGFSISTATMNSSGTWTVGHGLGVAPAVVLVKATGGTSDWWMWHHSLGGPTDGAKYIKFNSTAVSPANDSTVWNNTVPTSSVYSMGSNTWSGSTTFVGYCFAEKKGYSKFGKYRGNGSSDGIFVNLGFKPALVIFKETSNADNWIVLDNKRDATPNPHKLALFPNLLDAEGGDYLVDFTSNGFKIRSATGSLNTSGANYIYLAFAEVPLVSSNGVPGTAK